MLKGARLCLLSITAITGPLMLRVNLLVIYTIHLQNNKFVTSVKIKATDESKLNHCQPCAIWYTYNLCVACRRETETRK